MHRLLGLSALLSAGAALGQGPTRTLVTDSGRVVLHYFISGELSSCEWTDVDDRWGKSWAYKRDGAVIAEHQTRRIAGHASVRFEFHPNGAVSKAEYSDAPDAGIQWYHSTTTFDEAGNRTGFMEQGHDNDGLLPRPDVRVLEPPVSSPPQPEAVVEQRLFVNEVFLVNPTRWTCTVHMLVHAPSSDLHGGMTTIGPHDTLRIGSYSVAGGFEPPEGHIGVFVSRKQSKGPWYKMANYRLHEAQVGPEHRR